ALTATHVLLARVGERLLLRCVEDRLDLGVHVVVLAEGGAVDLARFDLGGELARALLLGGGSLLDDVVDLRPLIGAERNLRVGERLYHPVDRAHAPVARGGRRGLDSLGGLLGAGRAARAAERERGGDGERS